MDDVILSMKGISKKYGTASALDDVNLEIKRGEIYGLVGNNGAGKTTLMRLIAGHSFSDAGTMTLFGEAEPDNIRRNRKRTGFLIEEPGFFLSMSAAQNL